MLRVGVSASIDTRDIINTVSNTYISASCDSSTNKHTNNSLTWDINISSLDTLLNTIASVVEDYIKMNSLINRLRTQC